MLPEIRERVAKAWKLFLGSTYQTDNLPLLSEQELVAGGRCAMEGYFGQFL